MELDPRLYEPIKRPPEERNGDCVEDSCTEDVWRYRVVYRSGVRIRRGPSLDAPVVHENAILPRGFEFDATRSLSLDGIVYVKLRDGRGWVFEKKPFKVRPLGNAHVGTQGTDIKPATRDAGTDEDTECDGSGFWRVLELLRFTPARSGTMEPASSSVPCGLARFGGSGDDKTLRRDAHPLTLGEPRAKSQGSLTLAEDASASRYPALGHVNYGGPSSQATVSVAVGAGISMVNHLPYETQGRGTSTECAFDVAARSKKVALPQSTPQGNNRSKVCEGVGSATSRVRCASGGWTDSSAEDEEEKAAERDFCSDRSLKSASAWAAATEAAAAMVAAGVQGVGENLRHVDQNGHYFATSCDTCADLSPSDAAAKGLIRRRGMGEDTEDEATPSLGQSDGAFDVGNALFQIKEYAANLLASPDVQLAWYF